jgi:hypothetical protein
MSIVKKGQFCLAIFVGMGQIHMSGLSTSTCIEKHGYYRHMSVMRKGVIYYLITFPRAFFLFASLVLCSGDSFALFNICYDFAITHIIYTTFYSFFIIWEITSETTCNVWWE